MINDSTLKAAHAEIRRKKVQQWKQEYLKKPRLYGRTGTDGRRPSLAGAYGIGNVGARLHHDDP